MSRAYARRSLPWALASVFTILYATLAIARYRGFMWTSWDLGIFTEVVSHYGHLQAPIAEVKGAGFDFLGDHFSPILAILGPLYRIFPSPVTLLVAHSVLLGLSVVPVAGLALRRLGAVPAAIIAVSYGLSFGLVQAVQVDFHEIAFAMQPFHQLDTAPRKQTGTGLGLPVTKALVDANRARLVLTSEPGIGTSADVIFPAERLFTGRSA